MQLGLVFISDELEMMHCFLIDNEDHVTDDLTKIYVSQVRNISLDVEDFIDSGVHLDIKSNWFRRMLPSWMPAAMPATDLDAAVASMELLKARVEVLSQRSKRYRFIGGDSGSKAAEQTMGKATASNIFVTDREGTKKQTEPVELVKLIRNEDAVSQLRVISVLGTRSDLGVVPIKKAYDDPDICNSFRCRAWVKTTIHHFNPYDFIRTLLAQFHRNCSPHTLEPTEVLLATNSLLMEEFKKQMSNNRYLVVLEDVSSMVDWEALRAYLPDKNNGSCVIVHTQQLGIASSCVGHPQGTSELEKFSADHSAYVFFKEDEAGEETVDKMTMAHEWLDKHQLVGREMGLTKLFSLLKPGRVVSVWGMSGVGKSFLVKHLYYQEQINSQSCYDKLGWVNVSRPFNLLDLSWNLLLNLNPGPLPHCMKLTTKDPIQLCREYLHQHKCFIVIDGLQSVVEWDSTKAALELGNSVQDSLIIIITNEESVAKHCVTAREFVFNIKCLEPEHAFALFEQKTQWAAITPFEEERRLIIVPKCGGLPKVICAVADIARFINSRGEENFLSLFSERSLLSVLEANAEIRTESLKDLIAWSASYLRFYLDDLKYLSIFSPNWNIRRRRLVRRFIAEGYARENMGSEEEDGERFLSKLVDLSILQVPETMKFNNMRIPFCQLNGFFREYIMSVSSEDDAFLKLEGHHSKRNFRGRHLAISETWDRDRIVFGSIDFSRLRSFTVFGEWKYFFVHGSMRLLRALDLEDSVHVWDEDVNIMLKVLPCLKFLSLRGCPYVTHLPDSLGELKQLQTLDIRGTSVTKLPKSIIKLHNLQYIRAGKPRQLGDGCHHAGVKVPQRFWLLNLHTLGVVDIGAQQSLKEVRLRYLTQLHKLGVCGINRNNWKTFFSCMSDHYQLASLSLEVQLDEDDGCLELGDRAHRKLKSLKLYGLLQRLPEWTRALCNLQKLSLQMSMLQQDELDLLLSLPKLCILRLSLSEFQNDGLHFSTEASANFGLLEVSCNSRTIEATIKFSASYFLAVLKICCWGESSLLVSELEQLDHLKEVIVKGPRDETHRQHFSSRLDEYARSKGRRPALNFE